MRQPCCWTCCFSLSAEEGQFAPPLLLVWQKHAADWPAPTGDTQSMHARACIRSSLLDLLTKPCNPNNQQLFNSLSPHLTDYWRGLANVPECQIFIRVRSQRHRQQMAICSMKGRNTKHIFHLKKNWFPECFIIIVE